MGSEARGRDATLGQIAYKYGFGNLDSRRKSFIRILFVSLTPESGEVPLDRDEGVVKAHNSRPVLLVNGPPAACESQSSKSGYSYRSASTGSSRAALDAG